jgi:hypothetical protein
MERLFTPVKLLGPESMPCPRRADEERKAERAVKVDGWPPLAIGTG